MSQHCARWLCSRWAASYTYFISQCCLFSLILWMEGDKKILQKLTITWVFVGDGWITQLRSNSLAPISGKKRYYECEPFTMIQRHCFLLWASAHLRCTDVKWKTVSLVIIYPAKDEQDDRACYQCTVEKPPSMKVWGALVRMTRVIWTSIKAPLML